MRVAVVTAIDRFPDVAERWAATRSRNMNLGKHGSAKPRRQPNTNPGFHLLAFLDIFRSTQ